tara:strand:+ start:1085 stop:1207 length:123 start_codon:yes stop_codon:yes gene_type:complete
MILHGMLMMDVNIHVDNSIAIVEVNIDDAIRYDIHILIDV